MKRRKLPQRRGGIYLLVLVGSATVTSISLLGLTMASERRQAAERSVHAQAATQVAHGALELGIDMLARDPSWRWRSPQGWWFKVKEFDGSTMALAVTDRAGSDIADGPCRPVVLRGVGIQSTSRTMFEVELEPEYVWPDDGLEVAQALGANGYWRNKPDEAKPADAIDVNKGEWRGDTDALTYESVSCTTAHGFNGTDNYVEIPNKIWYENNNGTISLWYYQDADQTQAGLFSKDDATDGDDGGTAISIVGSRIVFAMRRGNQVSQIIGGTSTQGQWHHVVATFGDNGMALYLDGVLQGTDPAVRGWKRNYAPIVLGASGQVAAMAGDTGGAIGSFLKGSAAHLSLFPRALSEGEVLTLMDAQRSPPRMRIVPGSWRRVTE